MRAFQPIGHPGAMALPGEHCAWVRSLFRHCCDEPPDTPVKCDRIRRNGAAPGARPLLIHDGRIAAVGAHIPVPAGYARSMPRVRRCYPASSISIPTGRQPDNPEYAHDRHADLAAGVTTSNDFNASPESYEARRSCCRASSLHTSTSVVVSALPVGTARIGPTRKLPSGSSTPAAARAGVDAIAPYRPDCLGEVMTDGWRYGTSPDMTSMNEDTIAALVEEAHNINSGS